MYFYFPLQALVQCLSRVLQVRHVIAVENVVLSRKRQIVPLRAARLTDSQWGPASSLEIFVRFLLLVMATAYSLQYVYNDSQILLDAGLPIRYSESTCRLPCMFSA